MFGIFYGATGIFSSLIGFTGAALYSSVDDRIQGFHYMLYGQAVIAVLALIAVAMFVDDKTEYNQDVNVPEAVSYTHLDVYKRQVFDKFAL